MQRAIPERRMTIVLLAIVAAVATAPFAGLTGSAHSANVHTTKSWCPPMC